MVKTKPMTCLLSLKRLVQLAGFSQLGEGGFSGGVTNAKGLAATEGETINIPRLQRGRRKGLPQIQQELSRLDPVVNLILEAKCESQE